MPFIPHTDADVQAMCATLGIRDTGALFAEIPQSLRHALPERTALDEQEIQQQMQAYAEHNGTPLCFAGGGAYDHFIPSAVWDLATRGEFYSAYTPYQAEASQGSLQVVYEYQTMMTRLMAMDVANASLYDGASALAEAVLMAVRAHRHSKKILMPKTVHPAYRRTVTTIVSGQDIELVEIDFDPATGTTTTDVPEGEYAALVIPQPNFFGHLEDVHTLTNHAHARKMLVIAQVNPLTTTRLSPPGEWGEQGADIAVGEGQPFGIPLSGGGPCFGFMCAKKTLARQMPGRVVGRTTDRNGKPGFVLTLQAREQHIRRSRATSNICTNQGLMVTAATIYLALMGESGLMRVADRSYQQAHTLCDALCQIAGVEPVFSSPFYYETAVRLPVPVAPVLRQLAEQNIVGGVDISADYPELGQVMLVCATEKYSDAMIGDYAKALEEILHTS
jgi:glycine dehydrogenase subunit 1